MALVLVASPRSQSELSAMLCELEALGIEAFVRDQDTGRVFGLSPFGRTRIMVDQDHAAAARQALAPIAAASTTVPPPNRFRNFLKTMFVRLPATDDER